MKTVAISNYAFTYHGRNQPTLENIQLSAYAGDFILLTGDTGSGKSTLLRSIGGLNTDSGMTIGKIAVGNSISTRPKVASLLQNPDDQVFCTTVEDEIAFGLENLGLQRSKISQRINQALSLVGFDFEVQMRSRNTNSLSGGEKQRIALASLLALQPQVLLLDEPTSYLDPLASQQVLNSLKELKASLSDLTIILVTHQTENVERFANRFWQVANRMVIEADDLLSANFFTPPPKPKSYTITDNNRKTVLAVSNLTFDYHSPIKKVLSQISFVVGKGEKVALMGRNGSGKTTLIHCLCGILPLIDKRSHVLLNGRSIRSIKDAIGEIGIVFQNSDLILQAKTVRQEIAFGYEHNRLKFDQTDDMIDQILNSFSLSHLSAEVPFSLSQGQRQRVAIAASLSIQPRLLILDEPTTGQDFKHLQETLTQVSRLVDSHSIEMSSLLFSTHDFNLAAQYADRLLILEKGRLVFDGNPSPEAEKRLLRINY